MLGVGSLGADVFVKKVEFIFYPEFHKYRGIFPCAFCQFTQVHFCISDKGLELIALDENSGRLKQLFDLLGVADA